MLRRRRLVLSFPTALTLSSVADSQAVTFLVTNTNSSGAGSLSEAIGNANATASVDMIRFNIPGSGPHTIGGILPEITRPLDIDAFTEPLSVRNSIAEGSVNSDLRIRLDGSALHIGQSVVRISAGPSAVRGVSITGIRNEGNGILVSAVANDVSVDGCFVGVTPDGITASSLGNGIVVQESANIGLSSTGSRNLVSGNPAVGISLRGPSSNVSGALIGPDRNNQHNLGNGAGITITGALATDNKMGSTFHVDENVIAGNDHEGVRTDASAGSSNAVLDNSILDNGGLGIDLGTDGVTPNDADDSDGGPNGLLNYPELTFARLNGNKMTVEGFLRSKAGFYQVLFFTSTSRDPTGFGKGERPASAATVRVLNDGDAAPFRAVLTVNVNPSVANFVTATTHVLVTGDDTSEFSRAIALQVGGTELTVTNTNDSGAGSLREALTEANATVEANTILFAIPGSAPHVITPISASLFVEKPIIIDGYSQAASTPNTAETGTNANLTIEIDGSGLAAVRSAIQALSPDVAIRGLAIHGAPGDGISGTSPNLRVEGCFVGTDASGSDGLGNGANGIGMTVGSKNARIGGTSPGQRNVISGNRDGIGIAGDGSVVLNNLIGTDLSGQADLGNDSLGIRLSGNNIAIGGDEPGQENVIQFSG